MSKEGFHKYYLLLLLFFLSSCLNNVEDISTTAPTNNTEVSYSEDIQPILTNSCGGSGCHISNTQNGVNLTSYNSVMNSVGIVYGKRVVIPGNADESPLVDKIEPSPEFGARMPNSGSYLTPDEINLIRAWIDAGAEDN